MGGKYFRGELFQSLLPHLKTTPIDPTTTPSLPHPLPTHPLSLSSPLPSPPSPSPLLSLSSLMSSPYRRSKVTRLVVVSLLTATSLYMYVLLWSSNQLNLNAELLSVYQPSLNESSVAGAAAWRAKADVLNHTGNGEVDSEVSTENTTIPTSAPPPPSPPPPPPPPPAPPSTPPPTFSSPSSSLPTSLLHEVDTLDNDASSDWPYAVLHFSNVAIDNEHIYVYAPSPSLRQFITLHDGTLPAIPAFVNKKRLKFQALTYKIVDRPMNKTADCPSGYNEYNAYFLR